MAKPNSIKAIKQEKEQQKKEMHESKKKWYWRYWCTIVMMLWTLWFWIKQCITFFIPLTIFPIVGVGIFKLWFGQSVVEKSLAFLLLILHLDVQSPDALSFTIYYRIAFYTIVYIASVVGELLLIQILTLVMEKQKMDRKIEAAEALEIKKNN